MNKQQLLDIDNPTTEQAVMQQLLTTGSKTSLESDRRVLDRLLKFLPKTKMKDLAFSKIATCVADAATLAGGGELVPELPLKTNDKPAKTA